MHLPVGRGHGIMVVFHFEGFGGGMAGGGRIHCHRHGRPLTVHCAGHLGEGWGARPTGVGRVSRRRPEQQ